MLANCRVHATLPATDLERARGFYAEKLGLTPQKEEPGGLIYVCGEGSLLFVYPSQGAAGGTHTQAGWLTSDIEAEVADLKARGVVFEEYDIPGLKTVESIATMGPDKTAWFKDSEGNLLVLVQVQGNRI
jgi:catechol 2,3-dioxygenase-like lactoylglutathione lyase family enzyme